MVMVLYLLKCLRCWVFVDRVLRRGDFNVSIVQRLCGLLTPDVPAALQSSLYCSCLLSLRNYISGPGVPCMQTVASGNPWHPAHAYTKQVVLNERLPHRLLAIINENMTVTVANCDVLRAAVLCARAFCEDHSVCLEVGLRLGLRGALTALLTGMDMYKHKALTVSTLGALGVLVGHSHTFLPGNDDIVPRGLPLSEGDLFNVLAAAHRFLDALCDHQEFHPVGVLNCSILLKYSLPLVTSRDPIYKVCTGLLLRSILSL
jgi:hypothetical protein